VSSLIQEQRRTVYWKVRPGVSCLVDFLANDVVVVHATTDQSADLRCSFGRVELEVEAAMQTPDGAWRVEVVRRGRTRWYRVVNDERDIERDWLPIAAVQRVLTDNGVDMASLVVAA
jgi:hypothetical protein